MKRGFIGWPAITLIASFLSASALAAQPYVKGPADRWIELDLYWFDRNHVPQSVSQFLERMSPLYKNAWGRRGVIVNVGFMVDYIAGWGGQLDKRIPLAEFDPGIWYKSLAPEHRRVAPPLPGRLVYPPWTYAELKKLGEEFRRQAAAQYGIRDFKFGTFIGGDQHNYGSIVSGWRALHAEAYGQGGAWGGILNPGAILQPDRELYAAFPEGIPPQTPFYRFFAKQWGSLSRAIGLDALVLRDGTLDVGSFSKGGPYCSTSSTNSPGIEPWMQWRAALVRETKQANPHCMIIGYSTALSAIAEFTEGAFDLENVAREGYLDAWIDQSWGGAWNEYWNIALLGYTFQLANILTHAAQLSTSQVAHYVVIDPWDAWDPWDVIHTVPGKLQWEIWGYSHATVKTPSGDRVPAGMYISWGNHGDKLLSPEDVRFLARTIDAAATDASNLRDARGPTLVYDRHFLSWLSNVHPQWSGKEFLDDQAGMLMKWGVPILSVTRAEWLPQVRSDMFILQSVAQLEPAASDAVPALLRSGKPVAFVIDPAWGVDTGLSKDISLPCKMLKMVRTLQDASFDAFVPLIDKDLPRAFKLWQYQYAPQTNRAGEAIYETNSCPDLVLDQAPQRRLLYWNPPLFSANESADGTTLDRLVPDLEPYVLAVRTFSDLLDSSGQGPLRAKEFEGAPLAFHVWQNRNNQTEFLAGNLERTARGDSNLAKLLLLALPSSAMSSTAISYRLKELTGEACMSVQKGGKEGGKAEIPIAPNSSTVWVLEQQR